MNKSLTSLLIVTILCVTRLVAQEAQPASQAEIQKLIDQALKDFEKQKYDAALSNLANAEKADPKSPFIQNLIGATYTKKQDYTSAKVAFDKALEADPAFFPAAYNRAELLFLEKKYDAAFEDFTTLLARNPDRELLQFKVFLCLLFLDRQDGAQRLLKQMRMPGTDPATYYIRAAWEYHNGNKGKAREYLDTARVLFPEKTTIYDETFRDLGWNK